MNKFPDAIFKPKDAGNAQSHRSEVIPSANLGLVSLYLYNVRKVGGDMLRYLLEIRDLTVSVPRGGKLGSLNDRLPSTRDGAKGVSERYVFSVGKHRCSFAGLSFHELGLAPGDKLQLLGQSLAESLMVHSTIV